MNRGTLSVVLVSTLVACADDGQHEQPTMDAASPRGDAALQLDAALLLDARFEDAQQADVADAAPGSDAGLAIARLVGRSFRVSYSDYVLGPLLLGEHTFTLYYGANLTMGSWTDDGTRAVLRADAGKTIPSDYPSADFMCQSIVVAPSTNAVSGFDATCIEQYRSVALGLIDEP